MRTNVVVPEEAATLRHIRDLLKEKRCWRGVVTALNCEGKRTRRWKPVEVNGRVIRKGKPAADKRYVQRNDGRVPVVHYRCRREGQLGTCQIRQIPARVVEPLVVEQLRKLSLDPAKLQDLAG